MRYLIKFSYDGTLFYGYQKQPDSENKRTVEGELEKALFSINNHKKTRIFSSGRTDSIHVIEAKEVSDDFHARFMVKKKTYKYYLNMGEYSPINRNTIYQYNRPLDIESMSKAIKEFIGTHDFKIFASHEVVKESYVRTIFDASIKVDKELVTFTFVGDGFMKYQVRNMVGTLIKIGQGKLEICTISKLLNGDLSNKYVFTAKPEGLYLVDVSYK